MNTQSIVDVTTTREKWQGSQDYFVGLWSAAGLECLLSAVREANAPDVRGGAMGGPRFNPPVPHFGGERMRGVWVSGGNLK